MKFSKQKSKKGFGILEVLLAGVIIITMLGALVVLGKTVLGNMNYNAQRTQATYLAGEGIETVRQIRDSNYLDRSNTTGWNSLIRTGLNNIPQNPAYEGFFTTAYRISYDSADNDKPMLKPTGTDVSEKIKMNDGNEFFRTVTFARVTGFRPEGESRDLGDNDIIKVICKITWGNEKSLEMQEILTDSHPNY